MSTMGILTYYLIMIVVGSLAGLLIASIWEMSLPQKEREEQQNET